MIRFFERGYSVAELKFLNSCIEDAIEAVSCSEKECEECGLHNVCRDLTQLQKRLSYLIEKEDFDACLN